LPAHYRLSDGRRLEEVPPEEWQYLDEFRRSGLPGLGPYQIERWTYGEQMLLTANRYYVLGTPATPTIIIRFLPQEDTAQALLRGEVDILDMDSLLPQQIETLLPASAEGKVRIYYSPPVYFEQIDFALSRP
jgi:ABC-type transport system substrate-binding protein